MIEIGHNGKLRSVVERINREEDAKKEIAEGIKDIYAEAKSDGFNVSAIRRLVREERADKRKAADLQADLDAYRAELGIS